MHRLAPAFNTRDHTLMACTRGHAVQTLGIAGNQLDALQFGVGDQVTRPAIVAAGVDHDFLDRVGSVAELGSYGMETVDETGRHGCFRET